ncbi:G2 and S phase-expressed protein 1 isoform X3 [Balaenoptera musculus]|uniref:G2 and S phase-expressed protein 1 isoform X3 n=1 Tax=Balaenoptera musculus TaxID=9771 RepID=A0A8B8YQB9_BALMU|nr:G2 and S phase-expressed protein 1 isoform X3 [Balaenoptera musculus]
MEVPKKDDILLLADEKFDFDLSLSSSSANEDDEVFLGPVGHKERCIAASLELNHHIPEEPPLPASESPFTWSPLTGENFVEVYKEAHLLALQIQSNGKTRAAPAAKPEDAGSQGVDGFIQESKLKINLFERENEVKKSPKSLKRETYHLSDSPSRGPPPWGTQPPSGAALPAAPAQASRPWTPGPPRASCSYLPAEPSAAHPPGQAGTQKKATSKLLPPRASSLRGKSIPSALEKPVKEKPASPSRMKILNEKDSHSSVPPDKPRAARDVASLPAGGNHVVQGKRSLPVPNKSGLKKTMLKPPGCAGSLARKSSSGSVSGVSASVCASPAAGRAKPRERPSIPVDSSQSNTSQSGRTGLALPRLCLQPGPAGMSCRQSQRPGVAESTAEQPRAPTRAALTQPQTPGQGGPGLNSHLSLSQSSQMNKTGSTRRGDSRLNSKTKAMPSPTNHFKIPKCSTGEPLDGATPKSCRAQRPQSCTSVERTAPVREGDSRAAARPSDWSPDGSFPPASALPQALNFSPEKSDFTFSKSITTEVALDEAQPPEAATPSEALLVDVKLDQLSITLRAAATPLGDLPLIDFCKTPEAGVASGSGTGPLVDLLTNSPGVNRRAAANACHEVGQLIDLASPLILLSPEADKENVESPLLKF